MTNYEEAKQKLTTAIHEYVSATHPTGAAIGMVVQGLVVAEIIYADSATGRGLMHIPLGDPTPWTMQGMARSLMQWTDDASAMTVVVDDGDDEDDY